MTSYDGNHAVECTYRDDDSHTTLGENSEALLAPTTPLKEQSSSQSPATQTLNTLSQTHLLGTSDSCSSAYLESINTKRSLKKISNENLHLNYCLPWKTRTERKKQESLTVIPAAGSLNFDPERGDMEMTLQALPSTQQLHDLLINSEKCESDVMSNDPTQNERFGSEQAFDADQAQASTLKYNTKEPRHPQVVPCPLSSTEYQMIHIRETSSQMMIGLTQFASEEQTETSSDVATTAAAPVKAPSNTSNPTASSSRDYSTLETNTRPILPGLGSKSSTPSTTDVPMTISQVLLHAVNIIEQPHASGHAKASRLDSSLTAFPHGLWETPLQPSQGRRKASIASCEVNVECRHHEGPTSNTVHEEEKPTEGGALTHWVSNSTKPPIYDAPGETPASRLSSAQSQMREGELHGTKSLLHSTDVEIRKNSEDDKQIDGIKGRPNDKSSEKLHCSTEQIHSHGLLNIEGSGKQEAVPKKQPGNNNEEVLVRRDNLSHVDTSLLHERNISSRRIKRRPRSAHEEATEANQVSKLAAKEVSEGEDENCCIKGRPNGRAASKFTPQQSCDEREFGRRRSGRKRSGSSEGKQDIMAKPASTRTKAALANAFVPRNPYQSITSSQSALIASLENPDGHRSTRRRGQKTHDMQDSKERTLPAGAEPSSNQEPNKQGRRQSNRRRIRIQNIQHSTREETKRDTKKHASTKKISSKHPKQSKAVVPSKSKESLGEKSEVRRARGRPRKNAANMKVSSNEPAETKKTKPAIKTLLQHSTGLENTAQDAAMPFKNPQARSANPSQLEVCPQPLLNSVIAQQTQVLLNGKESGHKDCRQVCSIAGKNSRTSLDDDCPHNRTPGRRSKRKSQSQEESCLEKQGKRPNSGLPHHQLRAAVAHMITRGSMQSGSSKNRRQSSQVKSSQGDTVARNGEGIGLNGVNSTTNGTEKLCSGPAEPISESSGDDSALNQEEMSSGKVEASRNRQRFLDETVEIDEVRIPFCRACDSSSSEHHHSLCPRHPLFAKSGAREKLKRIRHGLSIGCPLCTSIYDNGVSAKGSVHHSIDCSRFEEERRQSELDPVYHDTLRAHQQGRAQGEASDESVTCEAETPSLLATRPIKLKDYANRLVPNAVDLEKDEKVKIRMDSNITVIKPSWKPSENPWGKLEHIEGDVVVSEDGRFTNHEVLASAERFTCDPFRIDSRYSETHFSPGEGTHALKLTRTAMGNDSWGFTVGRHDFGSACLVTAVDPCSPASRAKYVGSNTTSPLCVHDMILAVNGKDVGGMTEVGFEIAMETSGVEVILAVSRYKFPSLIDRLSADLENDIWRNFSKNLDDKRNLGWTELDMVCDDSGLYKKSLRQNEPSACVPAAGSTPDDPPQEVDGTQVKIYHNVVPENSFGRRPQPTDVTVLNEAVKQQLDQDEIINREGASHAESVESEDWENDDNPWVGCVCGKIHGAPTIVFWIQCESCDTWCNVAPKCVGFDEDEAKYKNWTCLACPNQQ